MDVVREQPQLSSDANNAAQSQAEDNSKQRPSNATFLHGEEHGFSESRVKIRGARFASEAVLLGGAS
jgi:hypothetical protein